MPDAQFQVRVLPTLDPPGLRLRAQPTTASATLVFEAPGMVLSVLEAETSARTKLGVYGQWLQVQDASGRVGYVAAWYVESASGASQAPSSTPAPTPVFVPPTPQSLVDAINAERVKNGLPVLTVHPILTANAQKHAEYMASGGGIRHESADGSRPFQRHLAAGYPLAGDLTRGGFASENIVMGTRMTVAEAITAWFGDAPHTNTMLGDKYNDCGAGVAVAGDSVYYCFDVARSTSANASPASTPAPPPPADGYTVYVPKSLTSGLRIRSQPSLSGGLVRVAAAGEWLTVQEATGTAKAKVGKQNQWLKIKDQQGKSGYVAAWLVSETP